MAKDSRRLLLQQEHRCCVIGTKRNWFANESKYVYSIVKFCFTVGVQNSKGRLPCLKDFPLLVLVATKNN